jgi:predicted RNA-binding Zn ribbon-like protein
MPISTEGSRIDRPVFRELCLIGGHPALDFLNTVKYRGKADPQDRLESLADIIEWAQIAELLSIDEVKILSRQTKDTKSAKRVHREICAFRELLRVLFEGTNPEKTEHARVVSRIEAEIAALRPVATIDQQSGVLTRHIEINTLNDLKARIVAIVAEILSARADLKIKTCGGPNCDWLFIDRTKAGRRQWCDTRTCGNNARVRRFRLKHNSETGEKVDG